MACLVMAMMMTMVVPPPAEVLEEAALVEHIAARSDMVADFSLTVSGGAEVVDIGHDGDHYLVSISDNGAGNLGDYSWAGVAGGRLLKVAHNGTVIGSSIQPYAPLAMAVSSDFVVLVGQHPSQGLFFEAYDSTLNLTSQMHMYSTTTTGAREDLLFYDLSIDGAEAYLLLGCPATGVELRLSGTTCATSTGRTSFSTFQWDLMSNTRVNFATSKRFEP